MKKFLLLLVLLAFVSIAAFAQTDTTKSKKTSAFQKATIEVAGNCGQCKERIEAAVDVPGVRKAEWSPKTGLLTVVYKSEKISVQKIEQLVADAGHDTKTAKSTAKTYNNLPQCCQYREGNPHK